jgi:hypothetical protein
MTVQDLLTLLAPYDLNREVVFLDPDTEWLLPLMVLDGVDTWDRLVTNGPVVITSDYSLQPA